MKTTKLHLSIYRMLMKVRCPLLSILPQPRLHMTPLKVLLLMGELTVYSAAAAVLWSQ